MANVTREQKARSKHHLLMAAAKCFLTNGYTNSTVRMIAKTGGINSSSFTNFFRTKEDALYDLVEIVLNSQFSTTQKLLKGKTEDKILFYALETSLQLNIVEMSEALRDVYSAAYSLPKTSDLIQQTVTGKWEYIFKEHLPSLKTKDFYKLEIATGGIMRGFMTVPCNMWFTIDQKIESFLECSLRMYLVPEEKTREAISFVKQFDLTAIAKQTIDALFKYLDEDSTEASQNEGG